ncbi:MAG: gliding motility-associated C-terminal domain-containing protein [Chitinophagaceae bacterium]|nr:gliding motility-associated C-terminal domain-containing protein [Chitinophagaceae bacterium]
MLIPNELRVLSSLILLCSLTELANAQSCDDWLQLALNQSYARFPGGNISSTKLTVEAKYAGGIAGEPLVSKYGGPGLPDYILRTTGAEITTANGYFKTPDVCQSSVNKVYHVALVYDGTSLKFYRNGFLMSEVPATGNLEPVDSYTYIGYNPDAGAGPFVAHIDEVRIWEYARPQELIRTYMNASLSTPAAQVGLFAYYTFENLVNIQGNPAYNLELSPTGATINGSIADCTFLPDSCGVYTAPPDSIIITNNVTICAGSHHQIKTYPADSYRWTPAEYLDDPTSPVPVATPPVTTTFYVEAFIAALNKTIIDSVRIRVERSDIKARGDTTICAGKPVQMSVTQGTSFNWSPQTGLSDPFAPNPVATPEVTTEYIVIGIGEGRCASADTVLITVKPRPSVVVSNDTVICKGAPVQLNANGGVSYEWLPSAPLDNPDISNPVATTLQTTLYTVNTTGTNGCVKTDTVTVEVRSQPDFTASGNKTVCEGHQVTLSASGGTSYQWFPAANVRDPSASSTIVNTTNRISQFSVHISEDNCGYDTTIAMTVTVNPNPVVAARKSNDINCATPTSELEATGANSYFWEPFVYLDNASAAKTFAAVDTTTTFTVTGYTDAGCASTATVTVNVDRNGVPRFVLPNAFSPNGDGHNDCFGIKRWGGATVRQFSIYNRWGQLVFQTKNPAQCWDGTYNGGIQAAGGYIYIIDATTLCGPVRRRGMISLIR